MTRKTYLGDSVYAELDGEMLKLTTDNGVGSSNTIYLEPFVYRQLQVWVEHVKRTDQLMNAEGS